MQIGFIGIGVMGRPMTLNLLKADHHVTIYARHPQKPEVQAGSCATLRSTHQMREVQQRSMEVKLSFNCSTLNVT
jgi:3-hydroxyisobutyrate dehydrogenase-like beta-hydroxyacid dehydrogenase